MGSTAQSTTSRSVRRTRAPAQRRAARPKAVGADGGAPKPPRAKLPKPKPALREVLDELVPEWQLQADIINLAIRLGYIWHHTPDSEANRRPPRGVAEPCAGLPDLILCRAPNATQAGRFLTIETKRQRGRMRKGQTVWAQALDACGIERYTFRPSDWSSGHVEQVLRA